MVHRQKGVISECGQGRAKISIINSISELVLIGTHYQPIQILHIILIIIIDGNLFLLIQVLHNQRTVLVNGERVCSQLSSINVSICDKFAGSGNHEGF